jgi:23S rRNA (uracil1939-C5)-methyltransferase
VVERLLIDRLGHRGDGVADSAAGAIYVPGALPGETAEVEPVPGHPDRRRLLQVEAPSAARISPICPHFGVCGGCAVQHLDMVRYRAWKRDLVVEALRQVGLDAAVGALIDAHGEGRRRAVFHARRGAHDVLEVGFSAMRMHRLVAIDRCPILAPQLDGAINAAWAIADVLGPAAKPLDIHVTATDAGLDIDVRGSGALTSPLIAALARVAAQHRLARLTRHGELIALNRAPTLRMGKAVVPLPPAAFLQATAEGEAVLARLVRAACAGATTIADLFSGIGPFALRLAEQASIVAIDNDQAALTALKGAAATTAGLKPVESEHRDLFKNPLAAAELTRFKAVIFDPPRQGAERQARDLAGSDVPRIVAVSCNPATFARDMRELVRGGYRFAEITPVDQFRYAAHVEVVARLEKSRAVPPRTV